SVLASFLPRSITISESPQPVQCCSSGIFLGLPGVCISHCQMWNPRSTQVCLVKCPDNASERIAPCDCSATPVGGAPSAKGDTSSNDGRSPSGLNPSTRSPPSSREGPADTTHR